METVVSIQILRAIAATAVAVNHAQPLSMPIALPEVDIGAVGVDLFFVISGFIMVYVAEPFYGQRHAPWHFFLRRLIRIVPLYWLITTIFVLKSVIDPKPQTDYSIAHILASYAFIPHAGTEGFVQPVVSQGWTLNYEMLFYLIFAVAILRSRRAAVLWTSFVLAGGIIVGLSFSHLPVAAAFWTDTIVLEFVFGLFLGLAYRDGYRLSTGWAWTLIAAGVVLPYLLGIWIDHAVVRGVTLGFPAALIVAGATLTNVAPTSHRWRPLVLLGDASYALYLFHPLAIRAWFHLTDRLGIATSIPPVSYLAAAAGCSMLLAIAIHYAVERPIHTGLKRLVAAPPAPTPYPRLGPGSG